MTNIKFTDVFEIPKQFYPQPASKELPEWYKDTNSYKYSDKQKGIDPNHTTATIKKCIPIFDAITSGYIIYSHCDVYVTQELTDTGKLIPRYSYTSGPAIEMHPVWQGDKHPFKMIDSVTKEGQDFPKWMNPWVITTPSGYSCFFTQPIHRKSVFTILTGIVDTDTYASTVNFPFVLNTPTFEGLIPAGTPIAQVIPFKRENWKLQFGNQKDIIKHFAVVKTIRSKFFNAYKTYYWVKKQYK